MLYPDIPLQQEGDGHDIVHMQCFNSVAQADRCFSLMSDRLLAVNEWHSLEGMNAEFQLVAPDGLSVATVAEVGIYIRINLPGPGNPEGHGYDWVKIVDLQEGAADEWAFMAMTVKPAPEPGNKPGNTAHFFKEKASSTFVVRKIGSCVQAEVHGRNEIKNTGEGTLAKRARNQLMALGAKLGLSEIQWNKWTEGLVSS